jgi:hypothetical protein
MSTQFKPLASTEKAYDTFAEGEKAKSWWVENNPDVWRYLDEELANQGEP